MADVILCYQIILAMIAPQLITETDYKEASRRLAAIFDASPGTAEYSELARLYQLIDLYEKEMLSPSHKDSLKAGTHFGNA